MFGFARLVFKVSHDSTKKEQRRMKKLPHCMKPQKGDVLKKASFVLYMLVACDCVL